MKPVTDKKTFWKFIWAIIVTTPQNIQRGNVNAAFDKMIGEKCVFKVCGKSVILDGKWLGYAMGSYIRPDYFLPPHFVLKPGMTVVDLGATAGDFAILAALVCDRVIAVEAKADSVEEMKKNAELNQCSDKIIAIHGIVGPKSGFSTDTEKGGEGEIFRKHLENNPPMPPHISLNDLLSRYNIDKVDFLKMDIEGSEFDLFSRDTEWLPKVDKIAAEVHSKFGDLNLLAEQLRKHGFEVSLVVDKGKTTVYGIGKELLYARRV